jgi:hypothetical protein
MAFPGMMGGGQAGAMDPEKAQQMQMMRYVCFHGSKVPVSHQS